MLLHKSLIKLNFDFWLLLTSNKVIYRSMKMIRLVRMECDLYMVHMMMFDSMLNTKWWQRLQLLLMDTMWMNSAVVVVVHVRCCFDSNKMVHHSNGCQFSPMKLKLMEHILRIYYVEWLFVRHYLARVHHHFQSNQSAYFFDDHSNRYHSCEDHFRCL